MIRTKMLLYHDSWNIREQSLKPDIHLRAESEINVESCFLSSGHTTESTLGQFWDLCQKASPLVMELLSVYHDIWDYCQLFQFVEIAKSDKAW